MTSLYLDCTHGARKETLAGALFALLDDEKRASFLSDFARAGFSDLSLKQEGLSLVVVKGGMTEGEAARARKAGGEGGAHHHDHHALDEVTATLNALSIPERVRADALAIYDILADAEAKAHGTARDEVHFHEVGNDYAIASIVSVCLLVNALGCDEIVASPITTGFGFVECAHGRLPIPAPATAHILEGLPTQSGEDEGELTTPTGAAIVRHFAQAFEEPA